MRCPHMVMLDKFFCISDGKPRRRKKEERRKHCAGDHYKKCEYFHDHSSTRLRNLHDTLRAS